MEHADRELFDRAGTQSRSLIVESRASCEDTERHIEQSRAKVAQSFRVLAKDFWRLREW